MYLGGHGFHAHILEAVGAHLRARPLGAPIKSGRTGEAVTELDAQVLETRVRARLRSGRVADLMSVCVRVCAEAEELTG